MGGKGNICETNYIFCIQAYNGHCEALKTLAETLVNLDVRDHKGRTALYLATERGSTECVEVLTSHGASALVKEKKKKWTPLHAAGKSQALLLCCFSVWLLLQTRLLGLCSKQEFGKLLREYWCTF